jgi:trimeric autotransporter adhesin
MSKLIGTNPNQVPSNADLGTAAFTDTDAYISALSEVNSTVLTSATDVFVYDTSKDSDGGAWRERCQDTSWYNERLNTAIRGSRREFPSIAVIVAELTRVTIYDGDDPSLPMWMIFPVNNNSWLKHSGAGGCKSVVAMNGIMFTGGDLRASIVRFVADDGNVFEVSYNYEHAGIVNRSTPVGSSTGPNRIYNNDVHDVAMTVLPNAPIDPATGLPVPTLGIGCTAGLTIITHHGQIVSRNLLWANGGGVYEIAFDPNGGYWYSVGYYAEGYGAYSNHAGVVGYSPSVLSSGALRTADGQGVGEGYALGTDFGLATYWSYQPPQWLIGANAGNANGGRFTFTNGRHVGNSHGLTLFAGDYLSRLNYGRQAYIHTQYNTGWMVGNTRLATLCDTEATDIISPTLVTNGTFATDSSWTKLATTISGGTLNISGTSSEAYSNAFDVVSGQTYVVSWEITSLTSGANRVLVRKTDGTVIGTQKTTTETTAGKKIRSFVSNFTGSVRAQVEFPSTSTMSVDNVFVQRGVADRSATYTGLQVYGNISKTPVAPGADLVAYSGFSSTNQIIQPYNNRLDFGTGDLSIMLWAKHTPDGASSAYYFFDKSDSDGTNRIGAYFMPSTNRIDIYSPGGTLSVTNAPSLAKWTHVVFSRIDGVFALYINGRLHGTNTNTENLSSSDGTTVLRIGARYNGSEPWSLGSLALFRVSDVAPSYEQVKQMYRDERMLFQDNAKATLYGPEGAQVITGMAYDDDTGILHAGNSAGRSDFRGLLRVSNTTTPVTTVISANKGMVIEQ